MTQFFLDETRENQPIRSCASQAALLPTGTRCQTPFAIPFCCRAKMAAYLAAQGKQTSLPNLDGNKLTRDPAPPGATAKRWTVCLAQGWMQRRRMHRVPGTPAHRHISRSLPIFGVCRRVAGPVAAHRKGLAELSTGVPWSLHPAHRTYSPSDGRCCFVPGTVIVLFAYSLLCVSPLRKANC